MNEAFNMYPILSKEMISKAGITLPTVTCYYIENDLKSSLNIDIQEESTEHYSANVNDPKCQWDVGLHGIGLQKEITITDVSGWFGSNGIASHDAIIGLALRWISVKSDQRGIVPFAAIRQETTEKSFFARKEFDKNFLKGSLILQTVVYLLDSGNPFEEERFLCTQTGTVLGVLDQCELFLEGNGSLFPIAAINDPNKPLWLVYYDETADPIEDSFDSDHVEIRLNKAHPNYDQLKIESSLKESALFLEVISSALMIIIYSAKESLAGDWDNVILGQSEFKHGSIAEAIHYFVVKLGWDISSTSKLAQSIRNFFDSNLKGGNL